MNVIRPNATKPIVCYTQPQELVASSMKTYLGILLVLFLLGIAGWWFLGKNSQSASQKSTPSQLTSLFPTISPTFSHQATPTVPVTSEELRRYSPTRKAVWSDESIGLKITTPEWIETREANNDWRRYSPDVNIDTSNNSETIVYLNVNSPYLHLEFLPTKYNSYTFSSLVNELLLPAGFCAKEWTDYSGSYTKST